MRSPTQILTPIVHSEQWPKFVEVLSGRREDIIIRLLNCRPEELGKLQGQVQELDYLLGLKQAILTEAQSKMRN